jgi:hypothetical protein
MPFLYRHIATGRILTKSQLVQTILSEYAYEIYCCHTHTEKVPNDSAEYNFCMSQIESLKECLTLSDEELITGTCGYEETVQN